MAALRKAQLRTGSLVLVLLVAGILAAVNIIAQRFFFRLDLTEDKRHSVAPATRAILEGMDDVIGIDVYFSRDLPPYLTTLRREVEDTLDEYRAFSKGNLSVEFKDPGDDPVTRERLRALGIPEIQLEILEKDQFRLTTAYMGIALRYGGRSEAIPVVQNTSRLEYELTSAILRLTTEERKSVGWIGGSREGAAPAAANPLQRELAKSYEIESLQTGGLREIPDGIDTLVLVGPRELPDEARFAVDQFLMGGGRVIFLVDHFSLAAGGVDPAPVESGVHDLLEGYGVRVNRDVVIEPASNAPASFSSGIMQFRLPYPFWPRVTRKFLNGEHPVTAGLESIVIPWTSSLDVLADEEGNVRAEVLAASTPSSWTESGRYDFSPQRRLRLPVEEGARRSRPLVVLLQGRFRSAWKDREPPPADEGVPAALLDESEETAILVIGSSSMAQPEFLRQFPAGAVFLMNAVDWMTIGADLIGIRSRTGGERALSEFTARERTLLKAANVVVLPALVALYGFVTLLVRRRRRNAG